MEGVRLWTHDKPLKAVASALDLDGSAEG